MIDFHAHPPLWRNASWLGGATFTAGDFLAFMAEAGIEHAVLLAHDGLFWPDPRSNDDLAEFASVARESIHVLGTVTPRDPRAPDEARRCLTSLGMRGLKLHPWLQGFSPHETSLDPILDVVAEHNGIVLSHDGTPPYSSPLQLAALARRHPDVPVVLGHGGLHDTWREALAAVRETPNLYVCLCGTPPYAARRIVREAPEHKVLFGTDAGLSDSAGQHYAMARVAEVEQWGISSSQRQAMLRDNPRRLLEI